MQQGILINNAHTTTKAITMPKTHNIAVLKGDGIGPEVTEAATKVLQATQDTSDLKLNFLYGEAGFHCIAEHGTNLPKETITLLTPASKGP
jgi:isocitrate/isopropylmalate dehydrogenase